MEGKYVIRKRVAGKLFLYEVFRVEDDFKVAQRKSDRTYVACLISENIADGNNKATHWYGRVDLIGKGDSRRLFGQPGIHVARLDEKIPEINH